MKKCEFCLTENNDDTSFCNKCGKPLSDTSEIEQIVESSSYNKENIIKQASTAEKVGLIINILAVIPAVISYIAAINIEWEQIESFEAYNSFISVVCVLAFIIAAYSLVLLLTKKFNTINKIVLLIISCASIILNIYIFLYSMSLLCCFLWGGIISSILQVVGSMLFAFLSKKK